MPDKTVDNLLIEAATLLDQIQITEGADAVKLANQLEEIADRIKASGLHLLEAANYSAKARLARARVYDSQEAQTDYLPASEIPVKSASASISAGRSPASARQSSASRFSVSLSVKIITACLLCFVSSLSLFMPLSFGHLVGAVAVTIWLIGYGLYQMRAAWLLVPALSFFLISYGNICLPNELLPDRSPVERINFALAYENDVKAIKNLGKPTEFFGWNMRLPAGWQEGKQEIKNDGALCIWVEPVKEEGATPASMTALLIITLSEDMQENLKVNTAPAFLTSLIQQALNGSSLSSFNVLPGTAATVGRVPYYDCPWDGVLQLDNNTGKHYVGEMALLRTKGQIVALINGVADEKSARVNPLPRSLLITLRED